MANPSPRVRAFGVFAAAALGATGTAYAACNATISDVSAILVAFDPFDGVLAFEEFKVTVVNGGSDACTLALAIKSNASGAQRELKNGTGALVYVIKTDGGAQMANDLQAPAGLIQLPAGAGEEAALVLRLEVPSGQISNAGSFNDTLTVRAFDISGAPSQIGLDITAPVNGFVPARAQINLAGGDAAFGNFSLDHLDFGELETGKTREAAVQVRSTAPVTVTVLSMNAGEMRHKVLGTKVLGVPYALTLSGVAANFSAAPLTIDRSPPITLSGESYPLRIVVGDVSGRVAGQYQDILTVSVVPR